MTADPITAADVADGRFDALVSYRYRHILKGDVLGAFPDRAWNLHISLLPWNRGADPNLWSFLERTPKGVTIHHMDEGLDTGDLVAQRELHFDLDAHTLDSAYDEEMRAYIATRKAEMPDAIG